MTSQTIPDDRVRIFGRDGTQLCEFRAKVERSWVIGDEGRAQFVYASRVTNIVNRNNLNFGNWLLIENTLLPAWVGVIDTPRTWAARNVTVSAYTPEHVFGQRRGPLEVVRTGSAGALFEYMLTLVNTAEVTIVKAGNISRAGTSRQETFNPSKLSDDLLRIYERSLEEYQWRPVVNDLGRLEVFADWVPQLGYNTSALLHEGQGGGNIEGIGNLLVEDGDILNDILGYGDGLTWASKPKQNVVNPQSIFDYGRRQSASSFSGVTSAQTLKDNTTKLVQAQSEPQRTFRVNALNMGDTFKYINLGNILTLQFQNVGFYTGVVGFETKVRIVAMKYDPSIKNKIELTVEITA